jgi:hypothetical protein
VGPDLRLGGGGGFLLHFSDYNVFTLSVP